VIAYADGEVRQEFNVCFSAREVGGAPGSSLESSEVRFVRPSEVDALEMHPTTWLRIGHYLEGRSAPTLAECRPL
jgi:hypothetical protein